MNTNGTVVNTNEADAYSKVARVTIDFKDGSSKFIFDKDDIGAIMHEIAGRVEWHSTKPIETLSKKYFFMLDEAVRNGETGYSKAELHELFKGEILPKLFDFKNYFTDDTRKLSTRNLSHDGWVAFMEQVKVEANHNFGYYFKD